MKKSYLTILILIVLFNSCNNPKNIELNCTSSLTYIKRNGKTDSTMLDYIKADLSKHFKIEFVEKKDTLFAYGYELSNSDESKEIRFLPPYLTSSSYKNTELNCSRKIIIHQNEIRYSFCYSDVFNFLDEQIKKSDKDTYYPSYIDIKENLINHLPENESIWYCDYIIYDFLLNLPFKVYDKHSKLEVAEIILSDYYSGWSGGSEYFLLNKKSDTIAYHILERWVY